MTTFFWMIFLSPFLLAWTLLAVVCWRRWREPEARPRVQPNPAERDIHLSYPALVEYPEEQTVRWRNCGTCENVTLHDERGRCFFCEQPAQERPEQ